jgi:hypothetical protein
MTAALPPYEDIVAS